jgi:hypothetical protein
MTRCCSYNPLLLLLPAVGKRASVAVLSQPTLLCSGQQIIELTQSLLNAIDGG